MHIIQMIRDTLISIMNSSYPMPDNMKSSVFFFPTVPASGIERAFERQLLETASQER